MVQQRVIVIKTRKCTLPHAQSDVLESATELQIYFAHFCWCGATRGYVGMRRPHQKCYIYSYMYI